MKYRSLDLDLSQCVCKACAPSTTPCGHETSGTRAVSFTEWFVIGSGRLKRTYSRAQKHWKLGGLGEPLISQINKTGGGRFWLSSNSKCVSWVPIPGLILVYYHHIHDVMKRRPFSQVSRVDILILMDAVTLDSGPEIQTQTEGAKTSFRVPQALFTVNGIIPSLQQRFFLLGQEVHSGWGSIDKPHLEHCRPREALCLDFVSWFSDAPLWLLVKSTAVSQTWKTGSSSGCWAYTVCQAQSSQ